MRIDVYTDAGVAKGVATWAAVIMSGGSPVFEASGKLKEATTDTVAAELCAAANGLCAVIRANRVSRGDTVRIICDNSRVVGLIKGSVSIDESIRKRHAKHQEVMAAIRTISDKAGIGLTAAGVKGHQPITSTCAHAPGNRRADELCRLARGEKPKQPPAPRNPAKEARRERRRQAVLAAVAWPEIMKTVDEPMPRCPQIIIDDQLTYGYKTTNSEA